MEITCPKCGITTRVPDEKLPDGPVRVKCKSCGVSFTIQKPKRDDSPKLVEVQALSDGRAKVVCPNCKTGYVIDPAKLSAGKLQSKCKKCGTLFSFIIEPPKKDDESKLYSFKPPIVQPPHRSKPSQPEEPVAQIPPQESSEGKPIPPQPHPPPHITPETLPDPFNEESFSEQSLKTTPLESDELPLGAAPEDAPSPYYYESPGMEGDLPLGVGPGVEGPSSTTTDFFVVMPDGTLDGPFTIALLRDWVWDGRLKETDMVVMPNGERKAARQMPELEPAFTGVNAPVPTKEEEDSKPTTKLFFSGVGAGALGGLGCGIPSIGLSIFFGMGLATFLGPEAQAAALITIVFQALVWVGFGLLIGTLLSTLHAINLSSDSDIYIWDPKPAGMIGAGIGFIIGALSLLFGNGGIFGLVYWIIIYYLLTRVIIALYEAYHSSLKSD